MGNFRVLHTKNQMQFSEFEYKKLFSQHRFLISASFEVLPPTVHMMLTMLLLGGWQKTQKPGNLKEGAWFMGNGTVWQAQHRSRLNT